MSCEKHSWATKAEALEYIKEIHSRGGHKSKKLPGKVYICKECGGHTNENYTKRNHHKSPGHRIVHDPRKFKIK